jgi:putative (di)nucleoside polyphosphate hydrolase
MTKLYATETGNYRPCVGIMLLNRDGLVFIGQRKPKRTADGLPNGHLWQMPQGGIDPGESPYNAAIRELAEETNVTSVSLIAEAPSWYSYDLPVDLTKKAWRGRYQGQRQKWFALRFEGDESEINVTAPTGGFRPEFETWRWERMDKLADLIIPFKRQVYENVVRTFGRFAGGSDTLQGRDRSI